MEVAKLNSPCPDLGTYGGIMLTQLMRLTFIARGDLARRFSLNTKFDRTVYLLWFLLYAGEFFKLPGFWLIHPSWTLLNRLSPEYGQFQEAPLTTLQAALWFAYPMPKILDLSIAEDRLRLEMLVSTYPQKPQGMPPLPVSPAALSLAAQAEVSIPDNSDNAITVFMYTVWRVRYDLQQAFPLDTSESRQAFTNWFKVHGSKELDLSPLYNELPISEPASCFSNLPEYRSKQDLCSRVSPECFSEFGINIIGSATGGSGIAKQGQITAVAASSIDLPVCMIDHGIPSSDPVSTRIPPDLAAEKPKYFASISAYNVSAFPNFIGRFDRSAIEEPYNIYYGNWEYPDYPLTYQEVINNFDEAWAPSGFTLEAWSDVLQCPVNYMPMAVTVLPWQNHGREYFHLPKNTFLFLFAFDFWSWIERKNPRACIESFRMAFPTGREPVGLVIKIKNVHQHDPVATKAWEYVQQCAQQDGRICLIDSDMEDYELHDLMRNCDAYVSLHRAEGFGFSIAEAMLLGKPVITTNYSGNTDYTQADNSCLVNCELVPVPPDHVEKLGVQSIWAEPDIQEAAFHMKRLYGDPVYAKQVGAAGQAFIERHYNCRTVGEQIRARLLEIYDTLPRHFKAPTKMR